MRIESSTAAGAAASSNSQQGNSAWNHAGTWEEKDKSVWARDRLKELVLAGFEFTDDTRKVSIKANSIVECDGDAKVRSCCFETHWRSLRSYWLRLVDRVQPREEALRLRHHAQV